MSVYAVASGRSRVPQVSVRDLEENTMCFEVRDTDCSTVNSLRRVMVGEVVSMAIDLVTFEENTSVVNDEIIAHRLGLVPIKYTYKPDKTRLREDMGPSEAAAMSSDRDIRRRFRHTRDCDCDSHCDFCAATLKLHVSFDDRAKDLPEHEKNNPLTVTTLDLVSDDPDVAPVHFVSKREESTSQETGIALVKLAKGQELKLTCIAKLGCGTQLDHGVTVVGYGTGPLGAAYWKIKNSWGPTWGESGYIRLAHGKDLCGVADSASQPTGVKSL